MEFLMDLKKKFGMNQLCIDRNVCSTVYLNEQCILFLHFACTQMYLFICQ